jgi:predicted negative regulator of RcsB-dependent stress response
MVKEENEAPVTQPRPQGPDELSQLKDIFREHGTPVLTGVLVAVVAVGGWQMYRSHKRGEAERASAMITSARDFAQIQQVATLYKETPSGAMAQLSVAADHFGNGRYVQAQDAYAQFRQDYPDYPLGVIAEYGLAQCLEATGSFEQALDAYAHFIAVHPDSYLAPQAELGRGRTLEQLGRLDDARVVYEDFLASRPESPWLPDATALLKLVERQLRAPGGSQG